MSGADHGATEPSALAPKDVDREYVWTYPTALEPAVAASLRLEEEQRSWTRPGEAFVYVHVPFCRADCKWCVFYRERFSASALDEYVPAVLQEISLYEASGALNGRTISAIYFGGGTASLLRAEHVAMILDRLRRAWPLAADAEVTLEGHPTTADGEYLREVRDAGVNRVSYGVQSFSPSTLRTLACAHRVDHAETAVSLALDAGMDKVNLDLIHRVPGQTPDDVVADVRRAAELGVTGMSCYSLEARGTRYEALGRADGQADDAEDRRMFYAIADAMDALGYDRVAQPDFARRGLDCKYLDLIWGAPQAVGLGLGPSALSSDVRGFALLNVSDLKLYCDALAAGRLPVRAAQRVDRAEAMARYFVLGFRRIAVPLRPFRELFGADPLEVYGETLDGLVADGLVSVGDDQATLTRTGLYFVDNVSKRFYTEACAGRSVPWGLLDVGVDVEAFPPAPTTAGALVPEGAA